MNGSTILSDDTFFEYTHEILSEVNNIDETFFSTNEENDSATSYEIRCNETDSSKIRTLGNKTVENLKVNNNDDPCVLLSNIRKQNLNRVIIGHININHLAGKFEDLKYLINDKLDV